VRLITLMARSGLALAALAVSASGSSADPVADFYQGKTVRVIIGYGAGGGYDIYGRLAAEFLGKHIPGRPTVIPQNMPGAGSFKAIEYLYGAAPQDGTYLGSVAQTMAMDAVTDEKNKTDITRLKYLGRLVNNTDVGYAFPASGLKTMEDLRKREVIAGASGGGSTSVVYPLALNAYAGTKIKLVRGYEGTAEIQLAMERGEVEVNPGVSLPGILTSHPDWVKNGHIVVLYQNALKRDPVLPNVPTMPELGTTDEGRTILRVMAGTTEIGRAILTTPGVPADRLAALRKAFHDMVTDPEFLAACEKRNMQIAYAPGEEMDAINAETMHLPKPTVDALRVLLKQ
jgi:tripartite-type tricarboxylate transporter receptor subunit TctC